MTVTKTIDTDSPGRNGKYKEKLGKLMSTPQQGKKPTGLSKVSFYHRNNRSMLAERGLISISKNETVKSEDNRSSAYSTLTKT